MDVKGSYPVFVFREARFSSSSLPTSSSSFCHKCRKPDCPCCCYELVRISAAATTLKAVPRIIPDGGVRSLGEVSSSYEKGLMQSEFCHVISRCGTSVTSYSCRSDGSMRKTSRPFDDFRKVHQAMISPWVKTLCGSDEMNLHRPGPHMELGFDSTICTYAREKSGKLKYVCASSVPCDRVRIVGIVTPNNYERVDENSGRLINRGITNFTDYILDIRRTMISRSRDKALIVVVGQNGSITRYREKDALRGAKMKPWEGYGDCMRPSFLESTAEAGEP